MNFFKSILLDDPEPPKEESPKESDPNAAVKSSQEDIDSKDVAQEGNGDAGLWSFGDLIKTIATRSESVIETYSRDLKEFGSGLRKESEIIREAASRAAKDLPASLEAGTSAVHGVLDEVLKSTAEIIAKESQVFASDEESETPEMNRSLNAGRYSWFETQLSSVQSDLSTFSEEPEDVEEYKKWKLGFQLEENKDEIEVLVGENGALEGVYKRIVPSEVDNETFWCRYFYRVEKLKQQEKVRANLVKRAISVDEDDDELSWEVDDEEEKEPNPSEVSNHVKTQSSKPVEMGNDSNRGLQDEKEVTLDGKDDNSNVGVEGKGDALVVSDHQAKMVEEEDDVGWDEIEDTGSGDEKKIATMVHSERPNRPELKKQLTPTEDDEDLSWDIEDDDEQVKS